MTPVGLRVKELREAKGLSQDRARRKERRRPAGITGAIENNQTSERQFAVLDRMRT